MRAVPVPGQVFVAKDRDRAVGGGEHPCDLLHEELAWEELLALLVPAIVAAERRKIDRKMLCYTSMLNRSVF